MPDTVLALIVTFVLLAILAGWVPLLHGAEALMRRYVRYVARKPAEGRERQAEARAESTFDREIAQ